MKPSAFDTDPSKQLHVHVTSSVTLLSNDAPAHLRNTHVFIAEKDLRVSRGP